MIVVDATVLVDFLAGQTDLQARAAKLMREDSDWMSVGLWRYEVGNVLMKMVRFGGADPLEMRYNLENSAMMLVETVDVLNVAEVWDIVCDTGLTYYDASYVWLARSRNLELRTRDKQVLRVCADVAVGMPKL